MRAGLQTADVRAISGADATVSKLPDIRPRQSFTDNFCERWFANLIKPLLPKDAGLHLHYITGFEERTCYRYAAGDSKPPAYFLRAILRSEQGEPFMRAIMDGSAAKWWIEFQQIEAKAKRYDQMMAAANQ